MDQWKLVLTGGGIAIVGMGVGAALFGTRPAVAQDAGFRECIVARQESVDVNGEGQMEHADRGHTVFVPPGWTPVGGGGLWPGNPTSTIVLCRR
ncbi:hypothetical protein [Sandaracinus amylolyticus]|uniref:hypothetical protein n=1 Tax=Sandaracinus amylolyticus TaxID=927083 RepID=UPI001F360E34|nr:hypothetical protein [Sandaracinus amylolyticus]UJR83567.1 Hypothetical protein I5071_56350 [Sandaracinus amylolyticus]